MELRLDQEVPVDIDDRCNYQEHLLITTEYFCFLCHELLDNPLTCRGRGRVPVLLCPFHR